MGYYSTSILLIFACCVVVSLGYTTSGNRILDPSGNPILLRGIARPSLEWNAAGEHLSLSDYQLMKGWGANVVRIGLSQGFWLAGSKEYNSNYKATVLQQVNWVKSLSMGVILDLHWSDQGNTNNYAGQQTMPDSRSVTFWNEVATAYKNDPWVIFELYNEPHDVSFQIWRDGGSAGGFTTPGMQALYNTVRATGANNAVIINGLNYAFDLSGVNSYPLTGTNIIYGTHPYDFGGKQPSDWDSAFGYLESRYPLIATEFGEFNCNPTYVTNFINYCNTKKISWTGWGWYPQGCGFPSLISSWDGSASVVGQVVKNSLLTDSKIPSGNTATTKSATSSSTSSSSTSSASTTTTTGGASTTGTYVYRDTVVDFQDWSWATDRSASEATVKFAGSFSYRFAPNAYQAVYFYNAKFIDSTKHRAIEFYINIGSGGQQVNFNMIRYDGANSNKIGPNVAISSITTSANTWTKATIDLAQFGSGQFDGFWFQSQSAGNQNNMYLDEIRVLNK